MFGQFQNQPLSNTPLSIVSYVNTAADVRHRAPIPEATASSNRLNARYTPIIHAERTTQHSKTTRSERVTNNSIGVAQAAYFQDNIREANEAGMADTQTGWLAFLLFGLSGFQLQSFHGWNGACRRGSLTVLLGHVGKISRHYNGENSPDDQ